MTKRERDGIKKAIGHFQDEHEGGWNKGMNKLNSMLRSDARRRDRIKKQRLPEPEDTGPTLFDVERGA